MQGLEERQNGDSDSGAYLESLEGEAKCPLDEPVLRQDVALLLSSDSSIGLELRGSLVDHLVDLESSPAHKIR